MQKFRVEFDDGTVIVGQGKSRDLVRLEADGIDISTLPPLRGTYAVVHTALLRMARTGQTDYPIPETVEQLMELADVEAVEDQGEGSGQEAPTG